MAIETAQVLLSMSIKPYYYAKAILLPSYSPWARKEAAVIKRRLLTIGKKCDQQEGREVQERESV